MDKQLQHELAMAYANSKMSEYLLDKRDAPLCGNISLSADEVQYLEKAYDFAIHNLSE